MHRIRARKRSVRESAAMDRELRELHAQMRQVETQMQNGGAARIDGQLPNYADLHQGEAHTTRHEVKNCKLDQKESGRL